MRCSCEPPANRGKCNTRDAARPANRRGIHKMDHATHCGGVATRVPRFVAGLDLLGNEDIPGGPFTKRRRGNLHRIDAGRDLTTFSGA